MDRERRGRRVPNTCPLSSHPQPWVQAFQKSSCVPGYTPKHPYCGLWEGKEGTEIRVVSLSLTRNALIC